MPTKKTGKPRGRPPFKHTPEMHDKVQILVAGGMTGLDIARFLGIGKNTLHTHFSEDMLVGRARKNGQVLIAQFEAAVSGNASAQRQWLQRAEPDLSSFVPTKAEETAEAKAPKLGKKEQAKLDANNPDVNTSMGQMMAGRLASVVH